MSQVVMAEECGPYQCRANDLATQIAAFKSDAAALQVQLDEARAALAERDKQIAGLVMALKACKATIYGEYGKPSLLGHGHSARYDCKFIANWHADPNCKVEETARKADALLLEVHQMTVAMAHEIEAALAAQPPAPGEPRILARYGLTLTSSPMEEPPAQRGITETLEPWLNGDPEMRYAEVLVGETCRWCVRLYQIVLDERGTVQYAAEAGTLQEALRAALGAALRAEGKAPNA